MSKQEEPEVVVLDMSTSNSEESADDVHDEMEDERKPLQQSEEVRLQIRKQYRDLKNETQARMESGETGPKHMINLIQKIDDCFKKVKNTREAAMDSGMINLLSGQMMANVETLSANVLKFRPIECAERFVAMYSGDLVNEDEDDDSVSSEGIPTDHWVAFGQKAISHFRISPSLHFMYGSFEANAVKKTRKRKPRVKDDLEARTVIQPLRVSKIESGDEETTTPHVERIYKILKKLYERNDREPLCYFRFVTNADSFSKTVENIFHVSFLVNDGRADITIDECGLPVICPVEETYRHGEEYEETNPFIMSLTMDEWEEIVKTFKIEEPYIPSDETMKVS